jgi:hypothetical protein
MRLFPSKPMPPHPRLLQSLAADLEDSYSQPVFGEQNVIPHRGAHPFVVRPDYRERRLGCHRKGLRRRSGKN